MGSKPCRRRCRSLPRKPGYPKTGHYRPVSGGRHDTEYDYLALPVLTGCGGAEPTAPVPETQGGSITQSAPVGLGASYTDAEVANSFAHLNWVIVRRNVTAKSTVTTVAWATQGLGSDYPDNPPPGKTDTIPNGDFTGDTLHAELHTTLESGKVDISWDATAGYSSQNPGACSTEQGTTFISFANAKATVFGSETFPDTQPCLWNLRSK